MSDQPQGPGWWQASDGKWYPPTAQPAQAPMYGQVPQPRPGRSGPNGCLIALAIVGALGILGTLAAIAFAAFIAEDVAEDLDEVIEAEQQRESEDVEVRRCGVGEFGNLTARLRVTNNSSEPSTYFIDVVFETANGARQVDSGIATVNELQPGQTTRVEAVGTALPPPEPPAGMTCRVADVQRLAS